MADFVYIAHFLMFAFLFWFSWIRTQHIIHPHFILTSIYFVFFSDFLVKGYEFQSVDDMTQQVNHIIPSVLYYYQFLIASSVAFVLFVTGINVKPSQTAGLKNFSEMIALRGAALALCAAFGAAIIFGELIKRLGSVDWSVEQFMIASLDARGTRPWEILQYQGNFIFAIASLLLPLGGGLAAMGALSGRNLGLQLFCGLLLAISIALLLLDGSRTPFVLVAATAALVGIFQVRGFLARIIVAGLGGLGILLGVSLMFLYRASGFANVQDIQIIYHQDDNYYRALNAMNHADLSRERWDPWFYFSTILSNPIPRALWPEKPLIDENFYGGFKIWWVTISAYGEWAALAGVGFGAALATVYGFAIYRVLWLGFKLINRPMGIVAYLLIALYAYQLLRSIQNSTNFIYAALAAVGITFIASWLFDKKRKTLPVTAQNRHV